MPVEKGDLNEAPAPFELVEARVRNGEELLAWEKLRLGLLPPKLANDDLGAVAPNEDP